MATLEKIRSKAGLLVLVVGLALFAFIIGDFLNSGSTYFRQTQERVAEVDGEVVKIQDYQARVDEMAEMYKMQTGSNSLPEEYMSQIRQSVFDAIVQEIVLDEATAKLGMVVTPEELFDMVQGENISPLIQQMQMFTNPQTGAFDKTALLNFLKTISDDNLANYPADQQAQIVKAKNFWLFWEKNIKRQRLEDKYTTLLSKAISANMLDAKEAFNENAESSDIVYAMQSYATIPDSAVQVSKSEIEKLYNQRKEMFKQKEGKVVKYIAVDIRPSKEDYDKAQADIESLKEELISSAKVADLVNENSEVPYMDAFFTASAFDPELKQFATTAEVGAVYGPVFENDKYRMFKLVDKTNAPDSVKVSHIMLAGKAEKETAALADSLMNVLKNGGNFEELAKQFSADQAAEKGGELGWFTEATALRGVNEEFKNAVFSTPVNNVALVKSLYGTHIVKVTDKTANVNKYKVADIDMSVSASSKTYSNIYNELNQFISKNSDIAKLDDAAKEAGYSIISDVTVTADNQMLGTIKNSRPVIRWAFQNDKGKVSEIFECDNKFVIAAVQGSLPEGYRPVDMVAPVLKAELINQKKGEKIVSDLIAKNLTSLDAYAQTMGTSVDSVKFISFGTRRIAGMGVEPKLNAMVSLTPEGKLSAPVAGNNGVYVFDVFAKNKENKEYNEVSEVRALDAANSYRIGFQAIQALVNKAKIEDNRIRFY
ncbi:peptidylprolyl isomerase [Parabacteroides chinchillae]|uniref:Periplasmic chaperone PpiD n=1 Tax=Parabacteroides chinchillae TaxID=871327 RepID=A0A8G2BVL9_9BACT|nr:peptidylprolyl isomerase [Parabacteroides chinchillae]SEF75402.1 peptidyl-prolyl cis-trans isomerase D [Parabacteroides chinchillae]